MDTTTLRNLPRTVLQKLAKENHIKANLKNDTIIELLLERQKKHFASPNNDDLASSRSNSHKFSAVNSDGQAFIAPSDNFSNPTGAYPVGDIDSRAEDVRSRSPSAETTDIYDIFATPESSVSGTPEPEADPVLLQRTVEMMADIDRIDKQTLDKITKLRIIAAKLRIKASDLRGLLQAERAMCARMEDYLSHWTPTNPRWTYEEVWSGQILVRNMYEGVEVSTSDEEDLEVQDSHHDEAIDIADQVTNTPQAHRAFDQHERLPPRIQLDIEAGSRIAPSIEGEGLTKNVRNIKRRRDEDSDDEGQSRYSPRARSEGLKKSTRDPAPPSPRKSPMEKGKRKRSSQEIESMVNQRQYQGDTKGSCNADQHDLISNLGMSPKDIRQYIPSHSRRTKSKAASNAPAPTVPTQQKQVKRRVARTRKAPV